MKKLLLAATLFVTPYLSVSKAATVTVGWWDASIGGDVTPLYGQNGLSLFTLGVNGNYVPFGPNFNGVLSALQTADGYYESAINNIFTNTAGTQTARIYTSFQGVFTGGPNLTIPTIFQRSEDALPGWTLVEQIFLCGNVLFCDNYIVGSGNLISDRTWSNGVLGTDFLSLNGFAPGQPFTITEVFHIVSSEANAHLAGAILTKPEGQISNVPGPVVGAGISGLLGLLGLFWWRRREHS